VAKARECVGWLWSEMMENCKDAVVIDRKSTEAYTLTVQIPPSTGTIVLHAYMP